MRRLSDLCLYLYGYYIYRYVLYSLEHDRRRNTNQRSSGSFTWYNKVYILSSPVCCMLGGEQTSLPVCSLPRVCGYQLLAYVSSKGNICLWAAHRVLLHFWCVYPRVWFMTDAVESVRWCVYPGCRETKKAARCTCYDVCPPRAPTGRRRGRGLPKKTAAPSTGESSFHYRRLHHSSHLETCENSSFDPCLFFLLFFLLFLNFFYCYWDLQNLRFPVRQDSGILLTEEFSIPMWQVVSSSLF